MSNGFAVTSWSDLAAVATVIGILSGALALWFAWGQLKTQTKQIAAQSDLERSTFEDSFAKEYRKIIRDIPTQALLGDLLSAKERRKALNDFYHYFDLCNEQAYLHEKARISDATWSEWKDGIVANLARPEFSRAWSYIASRAVDQEGRFEFQSLRRVAPPTPYDEAQPYITHSVNT